MGPLSFAVPAGLPIDELERRLVDEIGLRFDHEVCLRRTYYDTFDGKLYRAGWVLEHEQSVRPDPSRGPLPPPTSTPTSAITAAPTSVITTAPGAAVASGWLRLRPLGSLVAAAEEVVTVVPRRPAELADDRLARWLGDLTDGRALLAVVESPAARERHLRALDVEDKTVVRVVLTAPASPAARPAAGAVGGAAAGSGVGGTVVWVVPVRGYDAELAGLGRTLSGLLGDQRDEDPLVVAAQAVGRTPGVDPSAFDVQLDPEASADEAVRALLRRLLEVMRANEAGVRADLDEEFLHDFRVAVRRARSVLSAARRVLPEEGRTWLAAELRWLGQLTGPPRDLDVLLEDLERREPITTLSPGPLAVAEDAATSQRRADLGPFVAEVRAERRRTRAVLFEGLASARYTRLLEGADELAATATATPDGPGAVEFVERRLRRASRSLLRQGRTAVAAEEWHEVRKAGKRVRYLIEGFRSLLDHDVAATSLASLKGLQGVLGEAQDRVAHAELIREVALNLAAASPPARDPSVARALLVAGGLVERHQSRGRKVQATAQATFQAFDTAANRARLRRLVAQPADGPVATTSRVLDPERTDAEATDAEVTGDGG